MNPSILALRSLALCLFVYASSGREVGYMEHAQITPSPMRIKIVSGRGTAGAIGGNGTPEPATFEITGKPLKLESESETSLYEIKLSNISNENQFLPWSPSESEFEPTLNVSEFQLTSLSISLKASCRDAPYFAILGNVDLFGSRSKPKSFIALQPGDWARLVVKLKSTRVPEGCEGRGSLELKPSLTFFDRKFKKEGEGWQVSTKPIPIEVRAKPIAMAP